MESDKLRNIPDYISPYFEGVSQVQYYRESEKFNQLDRDIEDKFICLKDFSSSTPIINSAAFGRECLGGGFYFRYAGFGIVVDPGIGFTSLMHRNKIFINDIDAVIVTHSHLDHNCDVGVLSALWYDYNKSRERERAFFNNFFQCNDNRLSEIKWYMDEETMNATKDILDSRYVTCLADGCVNPIALSENITLDAIRTKHVKGSNKTYGIRFRFFDDPLTYEWGYTSDTRYFEELGTFFQDSKTLIFNISDIYPSDVEGRKQKNSHLGFDGSVNLLRETKPRIALASEFCCMNGDYRHEIIRALREEIEKEGNLPGTLVFPTAPGLVIDIANKDIRCSLCGKSVPVHCIKTARPREEYGVFQYMCSDCLS